MSWCQTDLRGKDISVQKLCSNHDGQVKECRRRKYGKDPSGSFGVWSGILSFSCKHCKQLALFFLHLPNRANINTTLKFKLNTIHTINKSWHTRPLATVCLEFGTTLCQCSIHQRPLKLETLKVIQKILHYCVPPLLVGIYRSQIYFSKEWQRPMRLTFRKHNSIIVSQGAVNTTYYTWFPVSIGNSHCCVLVYLLWKHQYSKTPP